jgi:Rrf2 family protein
MKLSAQEEYGLRCLLRLGHAGGSLTLTEMARQENISVANVAKMMRALRRGGLVTSTRGKDGGYTLAREPREINIGAALAVLGGRFFDTRFCDRHSGLDASCANTGDCSIRSVWRLLQDAMDSVLGKMSLQDLLRSEAEMKTWRGHGRIPLPLYPVA